MSSAFKFVGKTSQSEWVLEKGQVFIQHPSDAQFRIVQIDCEKEDGEEYCMFTLMRLGAPVNWNYAKDTLEELAVKMNASNWTPVT